MTASARVFLDDLIDYAGMFPPASLQLEQALQNYLEYRHQPEAWMLARFICPAGRLPALASRVSGSRQQPLRLSVLATGGETDTQFLDALGRDLVDLERAVAAAPGLLLPETLEARIPRQVLESRDALRSGEYFRKVALAASGSVAAPQQIFLEATHPDPDLQVAALGALIRHGSFWQASRPEIGFKIRCGGTSRDAFPSLDQLAAILNMARQDGLRVKTTAGLHHPLSHFDPELDTFQFGFVNLFGAGILAQVHDLEPPVLLEILGEKEASSFRFEEDSFAWRQLPCKINEIRRVRRDFLVSFGSCSFDEPRQDLAALGWLPQHHPVEE